MAVDNPEVVDAVGTEIATGDIVLTICDHLEWDDLESHLHLLAEKINRYLGFIESGELLENYPSAAGKSTRIDVYFQFAQPEAANRFIEHAREVAQTYGVSLLIQPPPCPSKT
jgi:hypothetical protein